MPRRLVLFDRQVHRVDLRHDGGVADGDGGGVRVGAVDDQLDGGIAAGVDPLGEIARHDQPEHHLARVDLADQVGVVVDVAADGEIARAAETG